MAENKDAIWREDAINQIKTEFPYPSSENEWLEIKIDNLINRFANLPSAYELLP